LQAPGQLVVARGRDGPRTARGVLAIIPGSANYPHRAFMNSTYTRRGGISSQEAFTPVQLVLLIMHDLRRMTSVIVVIAGCSEAYHSGRKGGLWCELGDVLGHRQRAFVAIAALAHDDEIGQGEGTTTADRDVVVDPVVAGVEDRGAERARLAQLAADEPAKLVEVVVKLLAMTLSPAALSVVDAAGAERESMLGRRWRGRHELAIVSVGGVQDASKSTS
jgi:hypothetical protein